MSAHDDSDPVPKPAVSLLLVVIPPHRSASQSSDPWPCGPPHCRAVVENYRPDIAFHAGAFAGHLGATIDGNGGDVTLRLPPLTFEPLANMPGSQVGLTML